MGMHEAHAIDNDAVSTLVIGGYNYCFFQHIDSVSYNEFILH